MRVTKLLQISVSEHCTLYNQQPIVLKAALFTLNFFSQIEHVLNSHLPARFLWCDHTLVHLSPVISRFIYFADTLPPFFTVTVWVTKLKLVVLLKRCRVDGVVREDNRLVPKICTNMF